MSIRSIRFSRSILATCSSLAVAGLAFAANVSAQSVAPTHSPSRPIPKSVETPSAPPLWLRTARIAPADPQVNGDFGQSVAVDGDTIATRQRGNAYVYVRDVGGNWTPQAKLVPPNNNNSSDETVALDGDNLVIGRPQDDSQGLSFAHGTAFIYHRTGTAWGLEAFIGGLPVGEVGLDVAMTGDVAAITGALAIDPINIRRRVGQSWSIANSINCCPGSFDSIRSIAMDETTFVIAGVSTSSGTNPGGALHFYQYDGQQWVHAQTIAAPLALAQDQYGIATDMSGDRLVVGAASYDDFGPQVGAAFVYARENGAWHAEAVLGPCDAGVRDFGRWTVIDGSTIVVSAQQRTDDQEIQTYRSVAYVFELTSAGWVTRQKLTIPEAPYATGLGISVELDEHTLAVGSLSEDTPLMNSGALYVFERAQAVGENFCFGDGSGTACPCGNAGQAGSGCANAYSTLGARLDAYGASSASDDRLLLSCRGVPSGANAIFYQGDAREQNGAGTQLMDGLRCITGSLVNLGTAASCDGAATFPPANSSPVSVLGSIPIVGATRYYQVAYASTGPCGTGSNFTNAVAIAWTL